MWRATFLLWVATCLTSTATGQTTDEIVLRDWLVIEPVGKSGRTPIHTDAIEAEIVAGTWSTPQAGDAVTLPDGQVHHWEKAESDDDGWLNHASLRGGYALAVVERDEPGLMLLEASGHSMVYVNDEPRVGDPYAYGWAQLPFEAVKGINTLLFRCGRGRVRARLRETKPGQQIAFNSRDVTLPDLFATHLPVDTWGSILVTCTAESLPPLFLIDATLNGQTTTHAVRQFGAPRSTWKAPFRIVGVGSSEAGEAQVTLRLRLPAPAPDSPSVLDETELTLAVHKGTTCYKVTFVSEIDGSVQYYAVRSPNPAARVSDQSSLYLTLHGAAVEATSQAAAYAPQVWGTVVAPTNRRPYGFDWEDWGRLDALEVMAEFEDKHWVNPQRRYLLGHSMGGHGVWHIGATFPDRFAAIAPSAGWISFESYSGRARLDGDSAMEQMLRRAGSPSDTLALSRNYLHQGVYILHGEQDDNVPAEQARRMRALLGTYHPDFAYYERPGAGHWWGNACVNWPPLFDFLRHHQSPAPAEVRDIEFVTASPGVSATCDWVGIDAQQHCLIPSTVKLHFEPEQRAFSGTTDNVARLTLDLSELSRPRERIDKGKRLDATFLPAGSPMTVELDGQKLEVPWPSDEPRVWLESDGEKWNWIEKPAAATKGPHRYGPFKEVFRNRFILVYGTQGTAAENRWALAKARYDAETFWYRGNGSTEVVADTAFDPNADPDRNAVLYGNADTNAAWAALFGASPVQIQSGRVLVGEHVVTGDDLACLTIWPRPGSDRALVGVVGGTGPVGMRLTDRLPYFVSGVAYPDCIVLSPRVLTEGVAGVRAAGFFGNDWSVDTGDFTWESR